MKSLINLFLKDKLALKAEVENLKISYQLMVSTYTENANKLDKENTSLILQLKEAEQLLAELREENENLKELAKKYVEDFSMVV